MDVSWVLSKEPCNAFADNDGEHRDKNTGTQVDRIVRMSTHAPETDIVLSTDKQNRILLLQEN